MPDWGLIGGIASGLQAGVESYGKTRAQLEEEALKRKLLQQQEEELGLKKDTASMQSAIDRAKARSQGVGLKKNADTGEYEEYIDPVFLKDKKDEDALARALKIQTYKKGQREESEAAYKKTTPGRYEGVAATEKKNLGHVASASNSLDEAVAALNEGVNTFSMPLKGDNKYTAAIRFANEEVGRLQSQGAINKDELSTFKSFNPTATDSNDIKKYKIEQMQKFLDTKGAALGFSRDQLAELKLVGSAKPKEYTYGLLNEPATGKLEDKKGGILDFSAPTANAAGNEFQPGRVSNQEKAVLMKALAVEKDPIKRSQYQKLLDLGD